MNANVFGILRAIINETHTVENLSEQAPCV